MGIAAVKRNGSRPILIIVQATFDMLARWVPIVSYFTNTFLPFLT